MIDSLYKVWINQLSEKTAGPNPKSPEILPKRLCKCMYFVTKAFSLIEFTGLLSIPITIDTTGAEHAFTS